MNIDELGYVPLSLTGSELLFEVFSQRYERGSTIVTSSLPFQGRTSVLCSERLSGVLLDRLTHNGQICGKSNPALLRHCYKTKPSMAFSAPPRS